MPSQYTRFSFVSNTLCWSKEALPDRQRNGVGGNGNIIVATQTDWHSQRQQWNGEKNIVADELSAFCRRRRSPRFFFILTWNFHRSSNCILWGFRFKSSFSFLKIPLRRCRPDVTGNGSIIVPLSVWVTMLASFRCLTERPFMRTKILCLNNMIYLGSVFSFYGNREPTFGFVLN